MDSDRVRIPLRLPQRLKDQIAVKAAENRRSINQEICVALERYVREQYTTRI